MKLTRCNENILQFSPSKNKFSIIWVADGHLESAKSKLKWMHKVFKDNPEAYIVYGGDNLDLMQGKYDKRGAKGDTPEHLNRSDYINAVVEEMRKELIEPYKDRLICFTKGNHNTSITRHHEVDIMKWLVEKDDIQLMHTAGFILVEIKARKGTNLTFPIYFQHHPPSGGKRSKGMLSVDLLMAEHPDAKCIISEHIHETFITPQTVERLNVRSKSLSYNTVWCIQAPTLKAEHEGKKEGFFHERIKKSATTIGAIKMDFELKRVYSDNKDNTIASMTPNWILYYD